MSCPGSWGSGERRSASRCSVIDVLLGAGAAAPSGAHDSAVGRDGLAAAQPRRRRDGEVHRRGGGAAPGAAGDWESTRLNTSHRKNSYAVFCLKKKKNI